MVIGLDIDDTITNSSELIIEYAKRYFDSDDMNLINSILNAPKIEGKILDFYYAYLPEMIEKYTIKENAVEVINRLKGKGYKIIIITARGYTETNKKVDELTLNYFSRYGIEADEIIFKARNKKEVCIEKNIRLMVDDSIKVLEDFKDTKVETVLFSSIVNINIETDIKRITNWLELEEYVNSIDVE